MTNSRVNNRVGNAGDVQESLKRNLVILDGMVSPRKIDIDSLG